MSSRWGQGKCLSRPRRHEEAEPDTIEQEPTSDAPLYRWDFDSEGDRSISYDTEDNRVTFDYDGYLFSLDLDALMDEPEQDANPTTEPDSNRCLPDDGTDYDTTYNRDVYGWTRRVWGGSLAA